MSFDTSCSDEATKIKRKTSEGLSADTDTLMHSQSLNQDLESVSSYQTATMALPTPSHQSTNSIPRNHPFHQRAPYPPVNMMSNSMIPERNEAFIGKSTQEITPYSSELTTIKSKLMDFESSNRIVMTQNAELISENKLLWNELLHNKEKNDRKIEKLVLFVFSVMKSAANGELATTASLSNELEGKLDPENIEFKMPNFEEALAILNDKGSGVDFEQMRKSFPSFIYSQKNDNVVQENAFPPELSNDRYSKNDRKAIPNPNDPKLLRKDTKAPANATLAGNNHNTQKQQLDIKTETNPSINGVNKKNKQKKTLKENTKKEKANKRSKKTKFSKKSMDDEDQEDFDEEDDDNDDYIDDEYEDEDYGKKKKHALKEKTVKKVKQEQETRKIIPESEANKPNMKPHSPQNQRTSKVIKSAFPSENPLNQPGNSTELKKEGSAVNPNLTMSSNPFPGFDSNAGSMISNMAYGSNMNPMMQQPFNQQQVRGMQNDIQNPIFQGGYNMQMPPSNDFRAFPNMDPNFPMQVYFPNVNPAQNMMYGQMNYNVRPSNTQSAINIPAQNINNLLSQNGQMNMGPFIGMQMQNSVNTTFNMPLQGNVNPSNLSQSQNGMNQQNNSQLINNLNPQGNALQQNGTPLQGLMIQNTGGIQRPSQPDPIINAGQFSNQNGVGNQGLKSHNPDKDSGLRGPKTSNSSNVANTFNNGEAEKNATASNPDNSKNFYDSFWLRSAEDFLN